MRTPVTERASNGLAPSGKSTCYMTLSRAWAVVASLLTVVVLAGCAGSRSSWLPSSGPSADAVRKTQLPVALIDVDWALAREMASPAATDWQDAARAGAPVTFAPGDEIEITLMEAAPALLLAGADGQASRISFTAPPAAVDEEGFLAVPYLGRIGVRGMSEAILERQIQTLLHSQAHRLTVMARHTRKAVHTVTVVGGAGLARQVPLSAKGERLLDAIAIAGGTSYPAEKTLVGLTRDGITRRLPLSDIVEQMSNNLVLRPADVVSLAYQPFSATALGAVAKNGEVPLEAVGTSLAQVIARSGGLLDHRADAAGVFVFRTQQSPTVFRIDLSQPASLLVLRDFKILNGDIVYVAASLSNELLKFLGIVGAVASPFTATQNAIQ